MVNVPFALVLNLHQPTSNPRGSPPAPGVGSQGDSLGHQSDPPLAVEVRTWVGSTCRCLAPLCWLLSTSVPNRDGFHTRMSPRRSVFSPFLPGSRNLQEEHACPDHNDFSVCSPGAIRLRSRCDRLSPALLLGISETMFRCAGFSTFNIR